MPKYERMKRGFMKVNELAKAAMVPASTIRYYMKKGLIKPIMETAAGYHLFELQESLQRLQMVQTMSASKPTLDDAKNLVDRAFAMQPSQTVQQGI